MTEPTNLHPDGSPLTIAEIIRYAPIEDEQYMPARSIANAAPQMLALLRQLWLACDMSGSCLAKGCGCSWHRAIEAVFIQINKDA